MKKCTKCNFKIKDVDRGERMLVKGYHQVFRNICPICGEPLHYINELEEKSKKFLKYMNIGKKERV